MLSLFRRNSDEYSANDDGAIAAAGRKYVVTTAPVVSGFKKLSKGDIERMEKRLEQRKEHSQNWNRYLNLAAQWMSYDTADTIALHQFHGKSMKYVVDKRNSLVGHLSNMENLKPLMAQQAQSLNAVRVDVAAKLQQIQIQQKQHQDRLKELRQNNRKEEPVDAI